MDLCTLPYGAFGPRGGAFGPPDLPPAMGLSITTYNGPENGSEPIISPILTRLSHLNGSFCQQCIYAN